MLEFSNETNLSHVCLVGLGVTNFNPSTTTPRNPYNPEHSTGGSSGGSGAAVAAGYVDRGLVDRELFITLLPITTQLSS